MSNATSKHPPHYNVYTRLGISKIHGIGVMAIRFIPKNTHAFYGDDSDLVWVKKTSITHLPTEIKKLYRDFCVAKNISYACPRNFNNLTIAWYLNHSNNPNIIVSSDYQFYAARDIKRGEELTVDYATYNNEKNFKKFITSLKK